MIAITIASTDRTGIVDYSSLRISQVLTSEPDTCQFIIKKFGTRTYAPSINDEVIVTQDGTKMFGGKIIELEEAYETSDYVAYRVTCTDYTHDLDGRLVVEVFENMTVLAIIQYLKANYLSNSVTINNVDVTTVIKYAAFNYEYVSEVLRQLAELSGADWYIDYDKDIHFNIQKSESAPFNLSDTGGKYVYESLVVRRDLTQLRNIVFVRGGDFLGDTVTAAFDGNGSQRYFYLPYKMSDLTLTVTGVQKSVGVDPIDDPTNYDAMHNFQEKTVFFRSDRIPRDTSALATNQKVRIGGSPNLPVIVKLKDQDSINTFTSREIVVVDERIKSKEGARQRAASELLAYRTTLSEAEFDTYQAGLHVGQQITVQSTLRGLNDDYIINKLEWRVFGVDASDRSTKLVCKASLVTTRTFGYTQLLQRLLNQEKKSLVIDEDEVVDLVEGITEEISVSDAVVSSVSHNPISEAITLSETTTGNKDYGESYVLGPWTSGYPHDTPGNRKRLFILNGSHLG